VQYDDRFVAGECGNLCRSGVKFSGMRIVQISLREKGKAKKCHFEVISSEYDNKVGISSVT
jgi:hypothetical protein